MIGYIEKAVDYFQDNRPKKAQSVPASLFWREEGMGIHYTETRVSKTVDDMLMSSKTKSLKYMPFHLFISEKHKLSFHVSDHPLQDGSTISDHVHRDLREVTIEGMFTNHPLKPLEKVNKVTFKDTYATKEEKNSLSNTALEKFEALKRLANRKEPVRIVCSLEIYPKMIITSVEYERDSKSGSSIRFTMTLREIQTVKLTQTKLQYNFQPKDMVDINDKLIAEEVNIGKRSANETDAKTLKEATQAAKILNVSY